MTHILLIRHAVNDFVKTGKLAGWTPGVHLNDEGKAQAEALGKRLAGETIHHLYSSPLERTMETAEAIRQHHPKLEIKPTTELGEVAKLRPEWDERNVKPIGLSVDPVDAHHKWELDIEETQGAKLDFPMIADPDARVATLYNMIHPESDPTVTVRSVFVIDPSRKVRLILTYPPSTGRNFAEILRAIDSLQLTDARSIATPVNWQPGEPVVISPKLSEEEASRQFPQGYKTLKPYLRIVDLQTSGR